LIRDGLSSLIFTAPAPVFLSQNRRVEFDKSRQLFIRTHNKAPIFVPMRVSNEECSTARIDLCNAAPTPTGFAEIVSDDFPIPKVTKLLLILSCQVDGLGRMLFVRKEQFAMLPILLPHNSRCGFKPQGNRGVTNHPCEEATQVKALFDHLARSTN